MDVTGSGLYINSQNHLKILTSHFQQVHSLVLNGYIVYNTGLLALPSRVTVYQPTIPQILIFFTYPVDTPLIPALGRQWRVDLSLRSTE